MNVIVFLAQGFEEVEALTVVDYLRRVDNISVDTVSIEDGLQVVGAHQIEVKADRHIKDLDPINSYDAVVIPGGLPGTINLKNHTGVIEIVKEFNDQDKLVAAICAGPMVLEEAKIINGKNVTAYPGVDKELANSIYKDQDVVVDGNILTGQGPAKAVEFALEIVKYLAGEKAVSFLKEDILYNK